jgi:hypothetical protein
VRRPASACAARGALLRQAGGRALDAALPTPCAAPLFPGSILSVVHNDDDGLFYVLRDTAVTQHVSFTAPCALPRPCGVWRGGDLLLVNRRACLPGEDNNATCEVSVYKGRDLLHAKS